MADGATEFLAALAQTEWLEPDRLQLYQRRLLGRLLRHARAETDFYRDRLAPVFDADDEIDWDRWAEVPILHRAEAQDNFAALAARSLVPRAGKAVEGTTSGSTGSPFRHYTTGIQASASACANERFYGWHNLDPAGLMAYLRATSEPRAVYPEGYRATGWRIGYPNSPIATLSVMATPVERQVEWLARVTPDYVTSYPTNLQEIARLAEGAGVRFDLKAVMTFGEATSEDARVAIRDFFGREPLDRYGSNEVGLMAATCPHSGKRHVMAELVLMEIVGDDGRACPPGVTGRVIVTPFYNHAMPLIRYEIGDYAEMAAEPCGCGRSLPTLAAIHGRGRNIFRFNDGTSVWPVMGVRAMQRFVPFRQYQLVQVTRERLELRYVPVDAGEAIDLAGLTDFMRRHLHPSVEVTPVAVEAIPRLPSGKFEDCVSLVS